MKFCVDCKHHRMVEFKTHADWHYCTVAQEATRNMVTGKKQYSNKAICRNMRNGSCGENAIHFEPILKWSDKIN